ncbi:beta-ketoacyl synthase N-terminal-like domain-containing protein [Actinokineospora sp. G85]|uniref:type I polyketide synthase n=1 Tax=Actinokineospora sp. G85 TaxID=3406626 RepID=UPI003C736B0F
MDLSQRLAGLSPQKRALVERLRGRPAEPAPPAGEPVAVVGMACRFPGGATDPDAFWRLLRDGVDATTPVPAGRWDPDRAEGVLAGRGGFLAEPVDRFDAAFFGISAREAEAMDPQHRLLLETAWAALEGAGQAPGGLSGARGGVFAGIGIDDYKGLQVADPAAIDAYTSTGNLFCAAAGRVSHVLGLTGPSMAVDTGCSSSLVAVHLAVRSLRAGECEFALAAGVHLMLSPEITLSLTRANALSPGGRCRTFDAAADGYARGEGCGVVVLKRLADALAAGDDVLAVVRGSAVNHDGPSAGLTVPNGRSQQQLIRTALADAGTAPAEVGYLEAHGTGTPLGDPIEVRAFGAALGADRPADAPLLAGSVKTNIGHLEAAAGLASLVKVVLALRHGELPAHLNLAEPSPHIPWDELPVRVPVERTPWPRTGQPRVAGISSFGIGGTNAHLVVAEAPTVADVPEEPAPRVLTVSARGGTALAESVAGYAARLAEGPSWAGAARTATTGRDHFDHRVAVVASSSAEAARLLADGPEAGQALPGGPTVAFLFTGQGAQYRGMGRALYAVEPVFRDAVDELVPNPGALFDDDLTDTALAQPAVFAVQHGLTRLWESWGVRPAMVLGHSAGEYAAACAAGVLRPRDAMRLVTERGRLMGALPRSGAMVAVFAEPELVEEAVAGVDGVGVAAYNGPQETVISGDSGRVAAVVGALGARSRQLTVSHAFHSPLMRPVVEPFGEALRDVRWQPARRPFFSTVTGDEITGADGEYWLRNITDPVRFDSALRALLATGPDAVVEVGPRPVLLGLARRAGLTGTGAWLPTLRKDPDDTTQPLRALAELYTLGAEVDWTRVRPEPRARPVPLPTYPFQRRRHWRDTRGQARTALPGTRLRSPAIRGTAFQTRYDAASPAWLRDHRLFGAVVVPGAAHLAHLLAALRAERGPGPVAARDITFPQALALPEGHVRDVQIVLSPDSFQVASAPADDDRADWATHATGTLTTSTLTISTEADPVSVPEILARCTEVTPGTALHDRMDRAGYQLGPSFRWLGELHHTDEEVLAKIVAPGADQPPAGLLDTCFQAAITLLPDTALRDGELVVPVRVDHLAAHRPLDSVRRLHIALQALDDDGLVVDLALLDDQHRPALTMTGVRLHRVPRAALLGEAGAGELRAIRWHAEPAPTAPAEPARKRWVVCSDSADAARELVDRLAEAGDCTLVLDPETDLAAERPDAVVGMWAAEPAEAALRLAQSAAALDHAPRLWLVTRGARQVSPGDQVEPAQAAVWGLARVIATELPRLRCTTVDIDTVDSAAGVESLLAELLGDNDRADAVAYRAGTRFTPRAEVIPAPTARRPELSADGAYLVTGGLGGIGLHVLRHLADRGARHLAVLSRGAPGPDAEAVLARLRGDGVTVRLLRADVTESLRELDLSDVRGVVHAAGVLDDGAVVRQDAARLRRIAAPKVDGARNLRESLPDLDFLLLFSSVAATAGTAGQGGYAAANAHLDALAERWRAEGVPATSLAWGAWESTGMTAGLGRAEVAALAERGVGLLTPRDALALLDRVLTEDLPAHVLAVRQTRGRPTRERRWETRPEALGRFTPPGTAAEKALAGLWEDEFRVRPIGADDDFFALGGDSMVALGVTAKARRHGLALRESDFFEHSTLRALAAAATPAEDPVAPRDTDAATPRLSADSRELLRQQMSGEERGGGRGAALRLAARLSARARQAVERPGAGEGPS